MSIIIAFSIIEEVPNSFSNENEILISAKNIGAGLCWSAGI